MFDKIIDQRQQHAESIAVGADAKRTHQRRVQAGHVGLDDSVGDTRGEQMQCCAGVYSAVPPSMRRQGGVGADVGANDQRIDDAGGRSGVREPFVPSRCHLRERECRTAHDARDGGSFFHIGGGVPAHTIRIGAEDGVNLIATNEFAIVPRNAQMPRHHLQPVSRQVPCGKVVRTDGVECIDQLAAWRDEAHTPGGVIVTKSPPRRPSAQGGARHTTQLQPDAQCACPMLKKRQIKSVEVVIFDDVRICGQHRRVELTQ